MLADSCRFAGGQFKPSDPRAAKVCGAQSNRQAGAARLISGGVPCVPCIDPSLSPAIQLVTDTHPLLYSLAEPSSASQISQLQYIK
jgi:hypothetical protein